ncbi:MAG: nuclear transport factor 2 family protein [Tissierellia bacterium]|nr:nuclear transport factor 2 family protein [Tissierellia bacterium]
MNIKEFWQDVLEQNQERLGAYFHKEAIIRWHCSNELFTAQEYIRANCEYPSDWKGEIERINEIGDTVITVTKVYPIDKSCSFHVVSFLKLLNGLIVEMDEYWSDDGIAPEWRRQMNIGKPIK